MARIQPLADVKCADEACGHKHAEHAIGGQCYGVRFSRYETPRNCECKRFRISRPPAKE